MTTQELRAIDARVHAEVFGKPVRTDRYGHHWTDEVGLWGLMGVPKYSEEIAHAWNVVSHLMERGPTLLFRVSYYGSNSPENRWYAAVDYGKSSILAETAPLAICLMALGYVKKHPLGKKNERADGDD